MDLALRLSKRKKEVTGSGWGRMGMRLVGPAKYISLLSNMVLLCFAGGFTVESVGRGQRYWSLPSRFHWQKVPGLGCEITWGGDSG